MTAVPVGSETSLAFIVVLFAVAVAVAVVVTYLGITGQIGGAIP